jgi:hypothetical protein
MKYTLIMHMLDSIVVAILLFIHLAYSALQAYTFPDKIRHLWII